MLIDPLIGEIERLTQNRTIRLFREELGYRLQTEAGDPDRNRYSKNKEVCKLSGISPPKIPAPIPSLTNNSFIWA